LIIVKTPFRISFAGGGSDFPSWFRDRGGAVVSATISRYCYLTLRELPPFFDYGSRFIWSRVEDVRDTNEIAHPAIRACLTFLKIDEPHLAMHHDADVPAQSGLGSSAAFTVGLLKALYSLQGRLLTPRRLALDAIEVDQDYAGDLCGCQDQIASAIGGINLIRFAGLRHEFTTEPVITNQDFLARHLMLFYTRQQRRAAEVERTKQRQDNSRALLEQTALVDPCLQALARQDMPLLGHVLQRSWQLKKSMATDVTNELIEDAYQRAMTAGALGGKLCGAGSGGCLLFVVEPRFRQEVKRALADLVHIPFKIEPQGCRLAHYERAEPEEDHMQALAGVA
jgi:D-glycero-alpha-D-manno-heptose-7-phosphate kinase